MPSAGVIGHKKGGGRKKGTPNKVTKLLKTAVIAAASVAGGKISELRELEDKKNGIPFIKNEDDLVEYLSYQAIENPGPFMSLLGKAMPLEIKNAPGEEFKVAQITFNPVGPAHERDND